MPRKKKEAIKDIPEISNCPTRPEPSMNEIDFLAIFVDNFNQYDEPARKRIIDYLQSRYHSYFNHTP